MCLSVCACEYSLSILFLSDSNSDFGICLILTFFETGSITNLEHSWQGGGEFLPPPLQNFLED